MLGSGVKLDVTAQARGGGGGLGYLRPPRGAWSTPETGGGYSLLDCL